MDIILSEVLPWLGLISGPAVGYAGYVHKRLNDTDRRLVKHQLHVADNRVSKDDYREDMTELKEMMREMRGDIKAILGGDR